MCGESTNIEHVYPAEIVYIFCISQKGDGLNQFILFFLLLCFLLLLLLLHLLLPLLLPLQPAASQSSSAVAAPLSFIENALWSGHWAK